MGKEMGSRVEKEQKESSYENTNNYIIKYAHCHENSREEEILSNTEEVMAKYTQLNQTPSLSLRK